MRSQSVDYNVPFFANTPDNTHCFQAALKMVLKFFRPEEDYSWKELEKITAKAKDLWTWPMAGLLWLKDNGFEIKNIEPFDYGQFIQKGEQYLINLFGKDVAEIQIAHSEMSQEVKFAKEFVKEIKPEVRIPSSNEIKKLLERGFLVGCNVNSRTLNNKPGYAGHFVIIKGFENDYLTIHDPGPPPYENRRVNLKTFERAWAFPNENAKNIIAFRLRS